LNTVIAYAEVFYALQPFPTIRSYWKGEGHLRARVVYLAKKTTYAFITVLIVIIFNFLLFRIMPGDPARLLLPRGHAIDKSLILRMREFYGLDKPIATQLFIYISQTLQLNFGYSFFYKAPVGQVIAAWLPNTLLLVGISEAISIVLGFFTGAIAGWKRGKPFDLVSTSFGLVFWSMPTFWIGIVFIMIFSVWLGIFPVTGVRTLELAHANLLQQIADMGMHLVLPVVTLTLVSYAEYLLIMRNSLIDVMTEDFVLTARAKGLTEDEILKKHVVPNALLPSITTIAIALSFIVGGALQTEIIFSYPGIGMLTWQALEFRDYALLQGLFFIDAVLVVIANFAADIIYTYIDPRVKLQ
jgi:peptide/nickel transport system permease protein